jgi:ribonucleoside-diphosphate reductase alpha chain
MQVIKRNGNKEKVSFDKILNRIESICTKLNLDRINTIEIAKETIQGLHDGITTEELDLFAAQRCAECIIDDPQYDKLAAGIYVSNIQKTTSNDFLTVTELLYNNTDINNTKYSLITEEYYLIVTTHIEKINKAIDYDRDFMFDFFGIKTLEKSYLIKLKKNNNRDNTKSNSRIVERPQHLFMRVSIGIHGNNIDKILSTYEMLSQHYFTHASPTLYNAGSHIPQLSSCFLMGMDDDIDSIFSTLKNAAKISKWAGGIGINISDIRAKGTMIAGTNGISDGVVPLMRHFNTLVTYINQGGRRNGALAGYIEPWHSDIFEFCELKKQQGVEEARARDIFLALWIPDLFMKRVLANETWSLMCPHQCPNLTSYYGDEFEELYKKYEREGKYIKQVSAKDLWYHILECQIMTGTPYMLYKDACNRKSNHKHYGTIKNSNLCAEILQYSDSTEYAVCNLASICLPKFVEKKNDILIFNYDKLVEVAEICTENLDKIIDVNYYPVEEAKISNHKHRPIGIGVQGLADVFYIMEIPFDSEEAAIINKKIFESIYYGAVKMSNKLAKINGPYETYEGSPFSKGQLQFHMWGIETKDLLMNFDWEGLIEDIMKYGMRNSLLTSIMPTASTSQIMNNTECIEPKTSNLYLRSTIAGEYIVVNHYLVEKLVTLGLWTRDVLDEIIFDNGSIQNINVIPQNIKDIFKTAFDLKNKPILDLAIGRGPFIDQTQSMNVFSERPDFDMLTKSHFYGWKNGIKTGMYYLRGKSTVDPIKFGMDPQTIKNICIKRGINNYQNTPYIQESVECKSCSG